MNPEGYLLVPVLDFPHDLAFAGRTMLD